MITTDTSKNYIFLFFLCLSFFCEISVAQLSAEQLYREQLVSYTNQLDILKRDFASKLKTIKESYLNSLEILKGEFQKSGEIDKYVQVENIIKKFKERDVMESIPIELSEITTIYNYYSNLIDNATLHYFESILLLFDSCTNRIASLIGDLTKSGYIDEAIKLKEYSNDFTNSLDVVMAKFAVKRLKGAKKSTQQETVKLIGETPPGMCFYGAGKDATVSSNFRVTEINLNVRRSPSEEVGLKVKAFYIKSLISTGGNFLPSWPRVRLIVYSRTSIVKPSINIHYFSLRKVMAHRETFYGIVNTHKVTVTQIIPEEVVFDFPDARKIGVGNLMGIRIEILDEKGNIIYQADNLSS